MSMPTETFVQVTTSREISVGRWTCILGVLNFNFLDKTSDHTGLFEVKGLSRVQTKRVQI
jgi:hypothetical protein